MSAKLLRSLNDRVAAASASLPMVGPSAIGKAFGFAAATRMENLSQADRRNMGLCQLV
jgi:hypothetical protein